MDYTELYLRLGESGFYGLGKSFEAVHTGDEDVSDPPILQFCHHFQPELCPFALFEPDAKNVLESF